MLTGGLIAPTHGGPANIVPSHWADNLAPPDSVVGNAAFGGQFGSAGPSGAAPPAGSITGAGQYTPDWAKLISGDPGLLQAAASLSAGGIADAASRDAAIQRAITQFGSVPDLATLAKQLGLSLADIQNILGPGIQQLAQENTNAGLSTEARLGQANTDAIRQIKNQLNARGLLNSGETGFQLDRQNTGYRQAESDAANRLVDYLNQYQQGYLSSEQTREGQLASAYSDAANRQFLNNQGSAGSTAVLDHVDASGNAVYRAPNGQLYDASGNPYTAPQAPSPPPAAPLPDFGYAPSQAQLVIRGGAQNA